MVISVFLGLKMCRAIRGFIYPFILGHGRGADKVIPDKNIPADLLDVAGSGN